MLYTEQFSEQLYTVIYNDGFLDNVDIKQKLQNVLNLTVQNTDYSNLINGLNNIRDDIENFLSEIYNQNNTKLKDYLYHLDGLFNLSYLCFNLNKLSSAVKNLEKYIDFKTNKFSNSDPSIIASLDKKIDSETTKIKTVIKRMQRYLNGLNKLFSIGFDSAIIDIIEPFLNFDILKSNGDISITENQLVKDLADSKIFSVNNKIRDYLSESYFNKLPSEGVKYIKNLFKDNQNNKFLNSVLDNIGKIVTKNKKSKNKNKNIKNGSMDYQDELAYRYALETNDFNDSDIYYSYE